MKKEINNKSLLFDLGLLPISNRFLKNKFEKSPKFPFKVDISEKNGLISLNKPFPVNEIKPRFDWITCSEPEDHLDTTDHTSKFLEYYGLSDSINCFWNGIAKRISFRIGF